MAEQGRVLLPLPCGARAPSPWLLPGKKGVALVGSPQASPALAHCRCQGPACSDSQEMQVIRVTSMTALNRWALGGRHLAAKAYPPLP